MNDIIWVKPYSDPGVSYLNHRVKHNEINAIRHMASEMYIHVPPNSVLVPVPGHTGIAIATKTLALHIAQYRGIQVLDYIRGKEREMLYMAKKRGVFLSANDFGFTLLDSLDGYNVILIDHIFATGTTFRALKYLIPHSKLLVHSKDTRPFGDIITNKII